MIIITCSRFVVCIYGAKVQLQRDGSMGKETRHTYFVDDDDIISRVGIFYQATYT